MTSYINDRGKTPTVGTVTSVAETFTGGIISVAGSPITTSGTLALTVAGTSGGVPYFSSTTAWASSGLLAANALVLGGGAGNPPATTTTGTGVVTALGVAVGSAGAFITFNGAGGTPSSMTATNLSGTAASLTAGTVTTNANLTGPITSTGNATAVAAQTGTGSTFVMQASPTLTTPKSSTTIGVGNATPSASGSGISFPATQDASTDANTLDDYEEGTWTPTDASGATLTFSTADGSYEKIGRIFFARSLVIYPATADGSNATIGGLPFTTANANMARQGFVGVSTETTAQCILPVANGTTFTIRTNAAVSITNATFSGDQLFSTVVSYV